MKSIIAAIILLLVARTVVEGLLPPNLTGEQLAHIHQMAKECMIQEKTTKETVEALSKGEFNESDRNVKCYTNCFLNKAGFMVDGVLQPTVLTQKLGPHFGEDKIKAIFKKCSDIKETDQCETAFKVVQCYHKEKAGIA